MSVYTDVVGDQSSGVTVTELTARSSNSHAGCSGHSPPLAIEWLGPSQISHRALAAPLDVTSAHGCSAAVQLGSPHSRTGSSTNSLSRGRPGNLPMRY